jgi:hypothetical protein
MSSFRVEMVLSKNDASNNGAETQVMVLLMFWKARQQVRQARGDGFGNWCDGLNP